MKTLILVCAMLIAASGVRADLPPAFTDIKLDAAKKQVDGTDKLVVIKFTAEWCGPCKAMDKTTWRDDGVVKWVKEHGVALQVDVDKDRKTAEAYNIEAMPTMVMLRGGKEIARTLGYMNPEQTLQWLDAAATGKAVPQTMSAPAPTVQASAVQLLITQLDNKLEEKKETDAVAIVRDLWSTENAKDPLRQIGLASVLKPQLGAILKGAPEAKAVFAAIRDEIENAPAEKSTVSNIERQIDRVAWNDVLGDDARSLAWIDRVKGEANGRTAGIESGFAEIAPLLSRHGRASEIPESFPDAREQLERRHEQVEPQANAVGKTNPALSTRMWADFEKLGGQVYAGFVVTKQIKDANEIAETMLQFRDTPTMRVALVEESVNAAAVGPGAKLWLDEAAAAGADVSTVRIRMAALQKK